MKKTTPTIIGTIIGDVVGSRFEWKNIKTTEFEMMHENCMMTDDTILTIAVADAILQGKPYGDFIYQYGRDWPGFGYGGNFRKYLASPSPKPYGSYGNGSAMRVSPVGFAFDDLETVLDQARQSAECTHNHPEGIKGAQAVAGAIFLARTGSSKADIREFLSADPIGYDLNFTIQEIRPTYQFDVSCQGSVPQAIVAFLESDSFESAIRLAISIGGDSDTIACIAGGMAAAFYGEISEELIDFALKWLPGQFRDIVRDFDERFAGK
jgi:ADP-ribosylglycohydrolase